MRAVIRENIKDDGADTRQGGERLINWRYVTDNKNWKTRFGDERKRINACSCVDVCARPSVF